MPIRTPMTPTNDEDSARVPDKPAGMVTLLCVAALLACYVALGLSASTRKSQTGDEGVHLTGGVSYWSRNDYRIQPENGNWPQRLCGLPVWLSGFQLPPTDNSTWLKLQQWEFAEQFFYECGNDVDRMLLYGRAMTAILGVALGLLIYIWSRRLSGPLAGLLSLALFAFSPTMLTHGFLITSDMASALFFTASVAAMWRLLHRVSLGTLLATWFTLSGLFLSKFAAPMIVPIGALLIGLRLFHRAPTEIRLGRAVRELHSRVGNVALFAGIGAALILGVACSIWASYGFRYEMLNPALGPAEVPVDWPGVRTKSQTVNRCVDLMRERHLLPEAYLFGFSHVMHYSEARSAFLNGEYRLYGWLSYFPYCFAYKTPLAFFVILAIAAAAAWRFFRRPIRSPSADKTDQESRSIDEHDRLYGLVPLAVLFVVYWAFGLTTHLNIGHRHLLPTYPALFIVAGAAAWWIRPPTIVRRDEPTASLDRPRSHDTQPPGRANVLVRCGLAAAMLFIVIDSVWIWPNYLAYFNVLAGGPWNGYRHLIDSSLDWNQDLKQAKAWLNAHPDDARDPQRLYFAWYGAAPPSFYGIDAQRLPSYPIKWQPHVPAPLTGGTYLISASLLPGVYNLLPGKWNEEYESRFKNLGKNVEQYRSLSATPEGLQQIQSFAPDKEWQDMFKMYESARFMRLASFLRQREPDDEIGYSLLVYRLTDAEVAQALEGPPVELLKEPEWKTEARRYGMATE
jgi:4-amino-4-deoxy-L-arabinose transferase-like glycosyltransferase